MSPFNESTMRLSHSSHLTKGCPNERQAAERQVPEEFTNTRSCHLSSAPNEHHGTSLRTYFCSERHARKKRSHSVAPEALFFLGTPTRGSSGARKHSIARLTKLPTDVLKCRLANPS